MPQPTPMLNCVAQREFTDRQEPQEAFLNMLNLNTSSESKFNKEYRYRVLHFYGVGGIGKSALHRHLVKHHLDNMCDTIYSYVDFDNPSNHDKATALKILSKRFRDKFKVEFPIFETIYAIYWSKENPHMEIRGDKKLPFLDEGSILAGAIGLLDGGLTGIAINTIDYIYKKFPKSLDENLKNRLKQLANSSIDDIKKALPVAFAQDLAKHIEKHNISKCVILLDTYEALKDDKWISDEFANNLPKECVLTICGREKLRWVERDSSWDEYIEQHIVGSLSSKDIILFLKGCKIEDDEMVEAIIKSSNGVPYYLDLCVDIYERNPNPEVEDFDIDHTALFDRFMKYLNQNERETLKVLSHARYYTKELFVKLVDEFKTYYPITNFNDFCKYSFISYENNRYTLHSLMRNSLIQKSDSELSLEINSYLLNYYESQFDSLTIPEAQDIENQMLQELFEEAYYHKSKVECNIIELSNWVNKYAIFFHERAKYSVVLNTLINLINILEKKDNNRVQIVLSSSCSHLAELYHSKGEYFKAEPLLEKALIILQRILGDEHPDTIKCYNNLAGLYESKGEYFKAEPLLEKALVILKRVLGDEHPTTITSYNNLAVLYHSQGKYSETEQLYKKALDMRQKVLGDEHSDTATSYNNLAGLYYSQKEYTKAEQLYKKALIIQHKVLGDKHPDTITSYNNLAELYTSQGEYIKAEQLYKKALDMRQKVLGDEHPDTATSYNNLAGLYYSLGDYVEAELLYKKSLDIRQRVLKDEHPDIVISCNNLAVIYDTQGEYIKAEQEYKKALDMGQKILGDEHPNTATSYNNLAGLYNSQGDYIKAELLYKKALNIRQRVLSDEHPDTIISYNNLAKLYYHQEKYTKAEQLYKKALDLRQRALGDKHPNTITSYNNLAVIYHSQGEYTKSEQIYKKALKISQIVLGEEHLDTAISYYNLAESYNSQGKYIKAEQLHKKALDIRLSVLDKEHPDISVSYNNLAILYFHLQRYQDSYNYMIKAIDIWKVVLPSNHPDLKNSMNDLMKIEQML